MKLLLIDNEAAQSDWIRRRLETENNQVIVSSDWKTGWALANESHYDIVLLAMSLPDSDQLSPPYLWTVEDHRVPILLIVSPDTPANKAWGLEAGADDCVGYSVDIRELVARLYALYRRRTGHFVSQSVLVFEDLEVNLLDRSVQRAGERIDLLPKEYYLLVFLLQNQGRVISKKEILECVWNSADSIRPNTVEVYINYLRNKIDRLATRKLIHTVVGMGYVIRSTEARA